MTATHELSFAEQNSHAWPKSEQKASQRRAKDGPKTGQRRAIGEPKTGQRRAKDEGKARKNLAQG